MRMKRTGWIFVLVLCGFWAIAPALHAQGSSRIEFGVNYNYLRANAPAGTCGCFSAQGEAAWAGWRFTRSISFVGEAGSLQTSRIMGTPAGIKLYSFLGGARLQADSRHRLLPFAQGLVGLARSVGDLTPGTTGLPSSENALGATVGGGADYVLTGHFSARAQADYFYTGFNNGGNNHQNSLRVSAGIVIRISPSY
jgi:opacity protein-like surface antigen